MYIAEIDFNLLGFYIFDIHVVVNIIYEKMLNIVVNICLNKANILMYTFG